MIILAKVSPLSEKGVSDKFLNPKTNNRKFMEKIYVNNLCVQNTIINTQSHSSFEHFTHLTMFFSVCIQI